MFELRTLRGPVQLLWNGQRVALRPMERTFILALVTCDSYTLPAAMLTRRLWRDQPSRSAADTTRSHAAHIRRSAQKVAGEHGQAFLVTDRVHGGSSYRLDLAPEQVDAFRFEQLAISGTRRHRLGSAGDAASDFEAALELWGGAPLADAASWDFGKKEIRRLAGIYRDCVVSLAEIRVRQGRYQEIIGLLEDLTSGPERFIDYRAWELEAMALYHSGRDGDAVLACKKAIEAFIEYGLPTGKLDTLLQQVLKGDLPR